MRQYLDLLRHVLDNGMVRQDRTGVGTKGVFGYQYRVDLQDGFPLLTTKKVHFKSVFYELVWFLQGRTDNQWLKDRGVSIWDEWSTKEQTAKFDRQAGDLGPVYGHQWRAFGQEYVGPRGSTREVNNGGIPNEIISETIQYGNKGDQIAWVIDEIKRNPFSRRLIVTGWNPVDANRVALPPCHTLFQFYVREVGDVRYLDCQLYQRSADAFLGVPFNLASYALLVHMVANVCGLQPGHFVHTFGDLHIYLNHFDQVNEQLSRAPRPLPRLVPWREVTSIFDYSDPTDFQLVGYDPHPPIKAPVAV